MGVDRVYTYIASLGIMRTVADSGQSWAIREYNKINAATWSNVIINRSDGWVIPATIKG